VLFPPGFGKMKKIEISLLLIVIIQIVLLMNLVPAQSYLINEITPENFKR